MEKVLTRGLKRLRKGNNKEPKYTCSNCKCKRYNPCTCLHKTKKRKRK